LHLKIIVSCRNIARKEELLLRRSFTRELPKLLATPRFEHGKKGNPQRRRARKRVGTIAGILVRELSRKLPHVVHAQYTDKLEFFNKILQQKRHTKHKIFTLYAAQTPCVAKGKQHKKYEFGAKACIAISKTTAIIVGALDLTIQHFYKNIKLCGFTVGSLLPQALGFPAQSEAYNMRDFFFITLLFGLLFCQQMLYPKEFHTPRGLDR